MKKHHGGSSSANGHGFKWNCFLLIVTRINEYEFEFVGSILRQSVPKWFQQNKFRLPTMMVDHTKQNSHYKKMYGIIFLFHLI
jgi:hypothetical protein